MGSSRRRYAKEKRLLTIEQERTPTFQRGVQGPCTSVVCFWQQLHEAEEAIKRSRAAMDMNATMYGCVHQPQLVTRPLGRLLWLDHEYE